jgi:mevalonate kinase
MQPGKRSRASAPGKVIVCGEHAVVYGHPAIALPVASVRASATVEAAAGDGIVCFAPNLGETWRLAQQRDHPLAQLIVATLERIGVPTDVSLRVTLLSDIPIASGMGSGAALGAALVRALAAFFGHPLGDAEVAALVYEGERAYHGTPSGIDNTVVSYEQPIWFVRGTNNAPPIIEPLRIRTPFSLVIGDTGVRAPTYITVGGVRERWQRNAQHFNARFAQIGAVADAARAAFANGQIEQLGRLFDQNQALLEEIGVSSPELDHLIDAARAAGALGAKLSGGGGGGIMIAVATAETAPTIQAALHAAGAVRVLHTTVSAVAKSMVMKLLSQA